MRPGAARPAPNPAAGTGLRPWHFFVLASLVASTAAVMTSPHPSPMNLVLVSLTIGAAGLAGFGFYRTLAPLALDEERPSPESLGQRARASIEREKMLVLRSIKELEFDRAMGKVSEADFQEMAARLRARAIALMKQIDDSGAGYHQLIEQELRTRLRAGSVMAEAAAPAARPEASVVAAEVTAQREPVAAFCSACGAAIDEDARFCKRCGKRLTA